MDERIFVIDDVPDDYELGDAQQMQVRVHKSRKPFIDKEAIKRELGSYTFPLYCSTSPDRSRYDPWFPRFKRIRPHLWRRKTYRERVNDAARAKQICSQSGNADEK